MGAGAAIIGGMMIGGSVLGALGQLEAGKQQRAAAEYDAKILEIQATDAEKRGMQDAAQVRNEGSQLEGDQIAAFASQNVSLDSEVSQALIADTSRIVNENANTVVLNASKEAWGLRAQAKSVRRGGQMAQSQAKWGAATTLFSGAAQTASFAYSARQTQVPTAR
jgi:hypothetical protein